MHANSMRKEARVGHDHDTGIGTLGGSIQCSVRQFWWTKMRLGDCNALLIHINCTNSNIHRTSSRKMLGGPKWNVPSDRCDRPSGYDTFHVEEAVMMTDALSECVPASGSNPDGPPSLLRSNNKTVWRYASLFSINLSPSLVHFGFTAITPQRREEDDWLVRSSMTHKDWRRRWHLNKTKEVPLSNLPGEIQRC